MTGKTDLVICNQACNKYALMATTLKWTKRIGLVLLALIVISAILWTISRALYPTAEQRKAVAEMKLGEPPAGKNAFAALWTLDRAVPPEEMAQVIERDAGQIAELPQFPDPDDAEATEFVSAAKQYPDLSPSPEDQQLFCNHERGDCLEKIAADLPGYRALVKRNRELLDRIEALAGYDFVRQQLPWNMSFATLPLGHARLSSTRHALWFAEGRVENALAASCRAIDTWRRLGASGDTLILRLVANAFAARNHGKLLAEMLAEILVDHALPAECEQALVPPSAQELSLCTAMRGEFELMTETTGPMLEQVKDQSLWQTLNFSLLYDAEATEAAQAQNLAPICAERELERIAADRREVDRQKAPGVWRFACFGNLAGCLMSSTTAASYRRYRLRMQDFGARIELLATLAWVRENADRSDRLEALLGQRPDALKSPTRQVEIGEDGDSLQIRMFEDLDGETWSLPLPSALQEQPGH